MTFFLLVGGSALVATGGGVVTYVASGHQLLGVAAGMKSPVWPGGAERSRILVFGVR